MTIKAARSSACYPPNLNENAKVAVNSLRKKKKKETQLHETLVNTIYCVYFVFL